MKQSFYNLLVNKTVPVNCFNLPAKKYNSLIEEVKYAKSTNKKENRHYWLLRRYDVLNDAKGEHLIYPGSKGKPARFYVKYEDVFDILHEIHAFFGHVGRDKMKKKVMLQYKNITVQNISDFLKLCVRCVSKNKKNTIDNQKIIIEEINEENEEILFLSI